MARLLSDFQSANPDSLSFASSVTIAKFVLLAVPFLAVAAFVLVGRRRR